MHAVENSSKLDVAKKRKFNLTILIFQSKFVTSAYMQMYIHVKVIHPFLLLSSQSHLCFVQIMSKFGSYLCNDFEHDNSHLKFLLSFFLVLKSMYVAILGDSHSKPKNFKFGMLLLD